MSLLGIDVGTSGCKAVVFSPSGELLGLAYEEYDFRSPQPGWTELDSQGVWRKVKKTIARAASAAAGDPISALAVSSMGEAMVPVGRDRRILGPSILNFDVRGTEYLEKLRETLSDEQLFRINGNTLGNEYGLTKLMWIRDHQPELYGRAELFLNWGALVAFMLGGPAALDYALANRSLLFDVQAKDWSEQLLEWAGVGRAKLPPLVPAGTVLGRVAAEVAEELNLSRRAVIVSGSHDQCANALGCGVIREGSAMFGMGTYLCVVPVYRECGDPRAMIEQGLNMEHHALADRFVCFIYNMSGSIVKWFRDTFAAQEHLQARSRGENVYDRLFAELPEEASPVLVLPYFFPTGPPDYICGSNGVFAGLSLSTTRGQVLKGILQGALFSLRERIEKLPAAGISIGEYRAAGGGSRSDAWVQLAANIFNRPVRRPRIIEAGALGAAILAGVGTELFASIEEGVEAMVHPGTVFFPRAGEVESYDALYARYGSLRPVLRSFPSNP